MYLSSWKVGRRCLALHFVVEVRLRRNEWFLLDSTVGLFFGWKEVPKLRYGLLLSFVSGRTCTGDEPPTSGP